MFAYLIELIAQEEIRYKKNPDAYDKELKEYTTNLSSQITVPANRVNAFMAMSIMGVVSAREAITAGNPIKIYGNNWFDEAKYLWTSFMILGWILPNKKFDHRAIRVLVNDPRISSDGDQKDINSQLGYFSRFSRTSLYEKAISTF